MPYASGARARPLDTAAFNFDLPDELIAQEPPPVRGASRLLVLHRKTGAIEHTFFAQVAEYLRPGDLLVLNNTKVFPARLLGRRLPGGGAVECLLLRQLPTPQLPTPTPVGRLGVGPLGVGSFALWEALMHPGQKLKPGAQVLFEEDGVRLQGEIVARHFHGRRTIRLWADEGVDVAEAIDRIGHVPLPPYIKRPDRASDRVRYQTIYARERGSIAAPTAGLHFTDETLTALAAQGVERTEVTLHVGYGTFKPIRASQVDDHVVDPEAFVVTDAAANAITCARGEGRRVIAVGTTTVRVLESLPLADDGRVQAASGETTLFIRPGHEFRIVDGLVTNFHLPQSSLLVLVAALAGREPILDAYRAAVERGYRFYSYGDAMLIL
jgi:S-adenosylmethionine:tRNA ribosyltransferase-isomerase